MSIFAAAMGLLLASPVPTADRTESIPLRHRAALEVDRVLWPERSPSAIPVGVRAWTIDGRRNAFVVTADENGLREARRLVEILDIPHRQIRLDVRVFRPGSDDVANQPDAVVLLDSAQLPDPKESAGKPELEAEMLVENGRPLRVRWPGGSEKRESMGAVLPRINGDGSVTLLVSLPGERGTGLAAGSCLPASTVRRVAPGQSVLVLGRSGLGIRIRVVGIQ